MRALPPILPASRWVEDEGEEESDGNDDEGDSTAEKRKDDEE